MKVKERLAELYPTATAFQAGKDTYETWAKMGRALGISQGALYAHKTALGATAKQPVEIVKNFAYDLTSEQIDNNIKQLLHGMTINIVKVYKIIDSVLFYQDVTDYKGLEFIREDKGVSWNNVCKNQMPYAISGRGQ